MPYVNIESPTQYYPETNYNCNFYYENELQNIRSSVSKFEGQKGPTDPPTIRYFNERKCPIYVHQIQKDSSVFGNYDEKLTTPRKIAANNQNNVNKMVLDKLEETYWATWKPKRESSNKYKTPLKITSMGLSRIKPKFYEHKAFKVESHGDTNDVINYFKAKRFDSSCSDTAARKASALLEAPPLSERTQKIETASYYTKNVVKPKSSVSQEIQTEVHCPVILEEASKQPSLTEPEQEPVKEEVQQGKGQKTKSKKSKSGSESAKTKQLPADKPSAEILENTEAFVQHKDSIEITKKKQEKEGQKEHYKQPKCIRLYRKTGATTGYMKGGTYPLKSCLRKDQGAFRLGPPGSPLFITSSSFSNRKRK